MRNLISVPPPSPLLTFPFPPVTGTFLRRYKRFLSDVTLPTRQTVVAHVANPGSMTHCLFSGNPCLLTHHLHPQRKLPYSLQAIQSPTGTWIGVNTLNANRIAAALFSKTFTHIRHERLLQKGWRPDYLVHVPELNQDLVLEVKNVTLAYGKVAAFPDAPTVRGQRHLQSLLNHLKKGHLCGLAFVIQREDVCAFHPAHWIDPAFAEQFWTCLKAGLWLFIYRVKVTPEGFWDAGHIPLLGRYHP